jgi:hypothetical protein
MQIPAEHAKSKRRQCKANPDLLSSILLPTTKAKQDSSSEKRDTDTGGGRRRKSKSALHAEAALAPPPPARAGKRTPSAREPAEAAAAAPRAERALVRARGTSTAAASAAKGVERVPGKAAAGAVRMAPKGASCTEWRSTTTRAPGVVMRSVKLVEAVPWSRASSTSTVHHVEDDAGVEVETSTASSAKAVGEHVARVDELLAAVVAGALPDGTGHGQSFLFYFIGQR